jgi:phosphatidylglycerophosphatase A
MAQPKTYKESLIIGLVSLFGLGRFPLAPGTLASLAAVGVFIFTGSHSLFLVVTSISLILSFLLCGTAERILAEKDPKRVVIDDFSGQLIALVFIPKYPVYIFLSFLLFRIFDTFKIPPADILDKKEGSLGIVGDDIVAGLYANLLIQAVILVYG